MLGLAALGWSSGATLAFADDKVPNEAAQALSPYAGWVLLVGAIAAVTIFILHSERWRRFFLAADDPRSIGLYRIVFGFFIICNVNDFWEYFEFLFTDEGIFTSDVARQVHAQAQFKGFGDGLSDDEPWGFFDNAAILEFLKGPKWSLLYFWDSPTFFWCHLWAFEIIGALFVIGLWSRMTGILTFLLMNSIFFRNHLFWEGTELVYRVFFVYLLFAKSGHAYSVDNWLRCRRLRKQGLLSERDGPGGGAGVAPSDEHPKGLQAIYRLIPVWPRRLMMLQLGAVYAFTGIVKNGNVWAKGDAIYYAWNMDHFYRFYPQQISAVFGTNLLRLMTWMAHWGEAFFAISLIGVVMHFGRTQKIPPLTGGKRLLARMCWFTLIMVSAALIWVTWTVHFHPVLTWGTIILTFAIAGAVVSLLALFGRFLRGVDRVFTPVLSLSLAIAVGLGIVAFVVGARPVPAQGQQGVFAGMWAALLCALWYGWDRLERNPVVVAPHRAAGTVAGLIVGFGVLICVLLIGADPTSIPAWLGLLGGWLVASIAGLRMLRTRKPAVWEAFRSWGTTTIDRYWICRWFVGRRIWIPWHIAVMGGIFTLMNIGQFQTGMLSQTIIFFGGLEVALFLRFLGRHGRVSLSIAAAVVLGLIASAFPADPMVAFGALVLVAVIAGGIAWWLMGSMGVPLPADVKAGLPPIPSEDPTLPHLHRDAGRMPQWALFATAGIALTGVLVAVFMKGEWTWTNVWQAMAAGDMKLAKFTSNPTWNWLRIWYAGVLFISGVAFVRIRAARGTTLSVINPDTGEPRTPWSYGPFGRFIAGAFVVWHITAVTTWLLPEKDSLHAFRGPARGVFSFYLTRTQTDQGWGMFAPNPPRTNVFLKVLVTDKDGEVWDMRTDVYAAERKPIPWIWNDRMRKMNRRIIGGESGDTSWYRKWHARYYCRKWALDHEGIAPKKVELVKVWYKMPTPEEVRKKGYYVPEDLLARQGEEKVEHTENCKSAVMGQLPDFVRERYGLPPLPENEKYKPWIKHKKKAWERARAKLEEEKKEAKEEDEDGKEKDPTRALGD
jgi:hypothetical protein